MEDWAEVSRLHRAEQMPVRAIARKLGSRNTVRRVIADDAPPKYQRAPKDAIGAVLAMALLAVAGVVPSWAAPQQHPPSMSTTAVAQSKTRTAADLPKPPKAMTLADRRKQITKTRLDRSPTSDFIEAPGRKPTSKPVRHDGHVAERGPCVVLLAILEGPTQSVVGPPEALVGGVGVARPPVVGSS
ncbi:hypothetical protein [Streptomyces sp. NPDC004065]|uniref:hypothetical protein n=1 Tax=Streptomyces sp. NPDC004065 TaxID=3364689 RepID=UPI00384C725D